MSLLKPQDAGWSKAGNTGVGPITSNTGYYGAQETVPRKMSTDRQSRTVARNMYERSV